MKLVIGGDHAGYALKSKLLPVLLEKGHEIEDMGCFDETPVIFRTLPRKCAERF